MSYEQDKDINYEKELVNIQNAISQLILIVMRDFLPLFN
jgi:hypothetical protein